MTDRFEWQREFVAGIGASTQRLDRVGANVPLKVENLSVPKGTNVGTTANVLTVTKPFLRITWGQPEDLSTIFTWTGKVRILKKSKEYPRGAFDVDAVLVHSETIGSPTASASRTYEDSFLDSSVGQAGDIWYYTVFYENSVDTLWAFSAKYSHKENWAYKVDVDDEGAATTSFGQKLYEYFPPKVRYRDLEDGGAALQRLCFIFGHMFDAIWEEVDNFNEKRFDPDKVAAGFLPYIDSFLGWPTNLELSETSRRRETKQAVSFWQTKGTLPALEYMLQTLTGWNVTLIQGDSWVLKTFGGGQCFDPLVPPTDWVEVDDGVWADIVNAIPKNVTFSPDIAGMDELTGTSQDKKVRMFSPEVVNDLLTGWGWQNPNGLLVQLTRDVATEVSVPSTVIGKMIRMIPFFLAHFWSVQLELNLTDEETFVGLATSTDSWYDEYRTVETFAELPTSTDEAFDVSASKIAMYTWPHPEFRWYALTNSADCVLFHQWLTFSGWVPSIPPKTYLKKTNWMTP